MKDEERNNPLTKEEFEDFLNNDFAHLVKEVKWFNKKLSFAFVFMGLLCALIAVVISLVI
jgi:hypothetical protein